MSNVFRRYHSKTGNEFYDNLVEIGILLTRFLSNEKNVPKSYRFIYTIPIINMIDRESDWVTRAYNIYPAGNRAEELLAQKQDAYQKAKDVNDAIIQRLQNMIFRLNMDPDRLEEIGRRLMEESAMLAEVRNKCRIQPERPPKQAEKKEGPQKTRPPARRG